VELQAWIRGIEKIFIIVDVLEDKKVNIRIFYLIEDIDFWWSAVKDGLLRPYFTWSTFLEELKMSGSMTVMQHATNLHNYPGLFRSLCHLKD